MSYLPNLITTARIILTPFVVAAIARGHWSQAFWIGFAAGLTDVLDGLLARALKVSSRVGAYLDPIADKLLLTASYLALGISGALPWWMVALVFGRDLFILAMAGYGYFFTPLRDFPPSVWGKLSTLLQIVAAGAVIIEMGGVNLPAAPFVWAMVVGTLWSGIHYGWRGWSMLQGVRKPARP